jgi:Tfp pilus assembly protein PilO
MDKVEEVILLFIICAMCVTLGYQYAQEDCKDKLDQANKRIKELESRLEQPMTLTKPIKMVRMRGMHLEGIDISLKGIDISLKGLWSGADTLYIQGGSK